MAGPIPGQQVNGGDDAAAGGDDGVSPDGEGDTRFWPNTVDSLIDHCWTNCLRKIISVKNLTRGRSDHNVIEATIMIKGFNHYYKKAVSRAREQLNHEELKLRMSDVDWTDVLECENIDVANSSFEEKVLAVLD